MVYHLILFYSFVASIIGFWISPSKFGIDFNVLSGVLKDVIDVQDHDKFFLGISIIKELIRIQINSERKKIAKNENDTLKEFPVRHVFKILVHP